MPHITYTPELSEGDQTWLASTRGIRNNRTVKLRLADFTVDPDLGYIPSGTPLALLVTDGTPAGDEFAVPYVAGGTGGTGVLAGFLFTDQRVPAGTPDAVINAPLMDHGRIRVKRLPVTFTPPADAATDGLFTYELT